jgi:hypothetical protein
MSAINIGNVIEICKVMADASSKITRLTGELVELSLIHPPIPGVEYRHLVGQIEKDLLIHAIVSVSCAQFMVNISAVRSISQTAELVNCRKVICGLLKRYVTAITDKEIAGIIDCDRSNVMYNRHKCDDLLETDSKFRFNYNQALKALKNTLTNHD